MYSYYLFIFSVLCETLQSTENIIVNFTSTVMGSNATYQCRDGSSDVYTTQCTSDGVWEPNPNSTLDCTRTVPMQNGVIVAVIILVIVTGITIVVVAVFYWRINETSELQHDIVLKLFTKVNVLSSEPVQDRRFQLVQQENTELIGEHHIGTSFTQPSTQPPLAPSHSPLRATVKVRVGKPDMCEVIVCSPNRVAVSTYVYFIPP